MTILTLNCFGTPFFAPRASARMQSIARHIQALKPDIICLQEVFLPWHKRIFLSALHEWRHRYVPQSGILGTGAGLCLFSKFPIESASLHKFSEVGKWSNLTAADKLVEKGWMELSFAKPRSFRLFHANLTCNYAGDHHPTHRIGRIQRVQLRDLSAAVRKVPRKTPVLIAGDLNIPPDSSILRSFLKATKSVDLTPGTAPSVRGNYFRFSLLFSSIIARYKIDYILGRGITTPTSWQYVFSHGEKLSDHLGILFKVEWEKQ